MVACCVVLIMGSVYLDLRIPEYMSEITYHLQAGTATEVVWECGIRMLACALGSFGLAIMTAALSNRVATALCRTLRERQFSQVGTWSRQDLDSFSVASLVTRSTNDVYHLQQFMGRAIQTVIKAPIIAVWAIFKIASSSFQWTTVTVIAMVILVTCIGAILYRGIPYIRKMQWFVDEVNAETREELEGMRTIRAYNAEGHQTRKFDRSSDNLLDNSVTVVRIMALMPPLASSMMNFLTMAIYWVGAILINSAAGDTNTQMILFSDMIVFTSYATQVLSAVLMATGILRQLPTVMVSSKRIEEVISHESPIRDGTLRASDAVSPGEVEFDHVSFTYPGTDKEVLHDVSFKVPEGGTLAIIGPTASGKSTMVNLVARLYDATSGTVRVGGVDVRDYVEEELSSMLGYVPQTAVMFSGTLRENVCYGGTERTDEQAMRAIGIAQLGELVERLPNGMDSDVSQHGWNLSGGQKQRVSIARAVCKDPPIYLFDDTFSALDSRTDRDLRDALDREIGGATRIIVAQRVGTILDADRILVIEDGRVVGDGRHEDLMDTCDLYREIALSQLEDFDDKQRAGCQGPAQRAEMDQGRRQAPQPHQGHGGPHRLHGARTPRGRHRDGLHAHLHRPRAHRPAVHRDDDRRDFGLHHGPGPRRRGPGVDFRHRDLPVRHLRPELPLQRRPGPDHRLRVGAHRRPHAEGPVGEVLPPAVLVPRIA